jgi:hypothetical protein
MIMLKNISSISDLYKTFLDSRDEKLYSESKIELLLALSEGVPTYSRNDQSFSALLNVLQNLGPKSAGEDCYTEFVALYLKAHLSNPRYVKGAANATTKSSINQILDCILRHAQKAQTESSDIDVKNVLQDCNNPRSAESLLHTVIIACTILNSGSAQVPDFHFTYCCRILAEIQRLNRKVFLRYFRCYLLWYFDEREVDYMPQSLIRGYIKMSPDLVSAECYDELITTVVRTTVDTLALRKSPIKSQQIEVLMERILELVPLSVAIKIISGPFYTNKSSRIRISAILFMEYVIAGAYEAEIELLSSSKNEVPQSASYRKLIDSAIMEMKDDHDKYENQSDNAISDSRIRRELQSLRLPCQVLLTDAGRSYCMIFNRCWYLINVQPLHHV